MSTTLQESPPQLRDRDERKTKQRRSPLRRRLIDAERGMSLGLKRDSSLFVYLFGLSVVIAAGFVLGLSLTQWSILIVCSTMILAAELINMALRSIEQALPDDTQANLCEARRFGSAAGLCTFVGSVIVVGLMFAERISHMWNG